MICSKFIRKRNIIFDFNIINLSLVRLKHNLLIHHPPTLILMSWYAMIWHASMTCNKHNSRLVEKFLFGHLFNNPDRYVNLFYGYYFRLMLLFAVKIKCNCNN